MRRKIINNRTRLSLLEAVALLWRSIGSVAQHRHCCTGTASLADGHRVLVGKPFHALVLRIEHIVRSEKTSEDHFLRRCADMRRALVYCSFVSEIQVILRIDNSFKVENFSAKYFKRGSHSVRSGSVSPVCDYRRRAPKCLNCFQVLVVVFHWPSRGSHR